jgi:hypothetical protein
MIVGLWSLKVGILHESQVYERVILYNKMHYDYSTEVEYQMKPFFSLPSIDSHNKLQILMLHSKDFSKHYLLR